MAEAYCHTKMKKLNKENIEDIFALTPMQEGMLFHYLKDPGSEQYFEQLSLEISGEIDVELFEKAWNFVIETNEMLRAVFRWEGIEKPVQIILKEHKLSLFYYDFSGGDIRNREKQLEEIKNNDRDENFDLRKVPFRMTLCKIEEKKYLVIISSHHILYDGWSNGIILKEFFYAYNDLYNRKKLVKPGKNKFKEFVKWVQNQDTDKQEKYWKQYLKNFDTPIEFPRKIKGGKNLNHIGNYHLILADETTNKLESFLKTQKITLATLFYGAWGILLQKYNYSEDIIFDTTLSGRSVKIKGIEYIVGLFINTLPFRVKTHGKEKIGELLSKTYRMLKDREKFQLASLVNIKEYSQLDKAALFDSVVVIENYPLDRLLKQEKEYELYPTSFSTSEITRYDLTIIIATFNDIEIGFTYDKTLFEERSILRLANYFTHIINEIISNPHQDVSEINILSERERKIILFDFNRSPGVEYSRYKSPIYILDKYQKLLPICFLGEIYASGNEIKFDIPNNGKYIEDTFMAGKRLIRTGNLARWLPTGNIDILGRLDNKVLINDRLLDPEKIGNHILKFDKISDVKVIARETKEGEMYLCSYVVSDNEVPIPQLREYLLKELADYMVPLHFVQVDRIPLKPNGKIERKILPIPGCEREKGERGYIFPGSKIEEKLKHIWSGVLHIDKSNIGVKTSFLELGGHSLTAKVLAARIHEDLKVRVPLEKLFELLTIREISKFIVGLTRDHYTPIKPIEKKEYYELSSAQKRFYILYRMDEGNVTFNMPKVYILEGKLDKDRFEYAFKKLSQRHETLRTSFHFMQGQPLQRVKDEADFKIEYTRCGEEEIERKLKEFVKPFNLKLTPLFRVKLIRVEEEKHFLFLDIHHIVSDGVSIEIMLKEFAAGYEGKTLSPLTIQYKDYATWHNNILKDETLIKQEKFWIKKMKGFSFTQLPVDKFRSYKFVKGKCQRKEMAQSTYHKINHFCNKHHITRFTFLIAIFFIVLEMEIGQQDITIGTPFVNRDNRDLNSLIGVFLNVLLIRSIVNKNHRFLDYLLASKKNLIEIVENSRYPYELLVDKVRERNNLKRDELFTILFNYFVMEENSDLLSCQFNIRLADFQEVAPKYEITLYVTEVHEVIVLDLVYQDNRFNRYRIKRILDNFMNLTDRVLENPEVKLSDLNVANHQVLDDFNPGMDELYENNDLI